MNFEIHNSETDSHADIAMEHLRKVLPNSHGVTKDQMDALRESGILRDIFDFAAVLDAEAVRRALRLDQIMTRKFWTVDVNYDLSPGEMIADLMKRTRESIFQRSRPLVWNAHNSPEWARKHPSEARGQERVTLETVRFQPNVGGERVLIELEREGLEFADYSHMTHYLAKYARRLSTERKLMITRREYVNRSMRPERQLVLWWENNTSPHMCVAHDNDPDFGYQNQRWSAADILVVRK